MNVDTAVLGGPADEHHRRARLVPGQRAGRRDPRLPPGSDTTRPPTAPNAKLPAARWI